jgi:hypothetical protein
MLDQNTLKDFMDTLPPILDIGDIARLLRVTRLTVIREIWRGRLAAYKMQEQSRPWNILREDLIAYLQTNSNL